MIVNIFFQGMMFPIAKVVADRFNLTEGQEIESQKELDKILKQHNEHTVLLVIATKRIAN